LPFFRAYVHSTPHIARQLDIIKGDLGTYCPKVRGTGVEREKAATHEAGVYGARGKGDAAWIEASCRHSMLLRDLLSASGLCSIRLSGAVVVLG
jgi:hypothetical protein